MGRPTGHANEYTRLQFVLANQQRTLKCLADALGQRGRQHGIALFKQDGKTAAPCACDQWRVLCPQVLLGLLCQQLPHMLQQQVTQGLPEHLIDLLGAAQLQHQQSHRAICAMALGVGLISRGVYGDLGGAQAMKLVGQASEFVELCAAFNLGLACLVLFPNATRPNQPAECLDRQTRQSKRQPKGAPTVLQQ